MIKYVTNWLRRYFSDPDIVALFLLIATIVLIFIIFGDILLPVLASIVIAYLLQWGVRYLEKIRVPHILAVLLVYVIFVAAVFFALLGLLPSLWHQLSNMVNEFPTTLGKGQALLMHLPERYPNYFSPTQIQQFLAEFKLELARLGQIILSLSLASITSAITIIVYLVLVPMLVYFFLMDQSVILQWFGRYLPKHRSVISQVWGEVHTQIGNYVGGKFIEIIIVWVASYIVFWIMGLKYAMLLSALVGLSVLVPYIGAVVVTVPVLLIAFLQWGWSSSFAYLVIAYTIIITLDANVLAPVLFSEAVALHPVAIILATLVFGRLWGFWGVFFAIPLATLVKAILNVFPHDQDLVSKS